MSTLLILRDTDNDVHYAQISKGELDTYNLTAMDGQNAEQSGDQGDQIDEIFARFGLDAESTHEPDLEHLLGVLETTNRITQIITIYHS